MSRTYDCPNCGAPVTFESSIAAHVVCGHCQSVVVRRDLSVETLGKVAKLPADLSPLQLGARGRIGEKSFVLRGRVRVAYEDGGWTEWYAEWEDGRTGWLAEAQGVWMVLFEHEAPRGFPSRGELRMNFSVQIQGAWFKVSDRRNVQVIGAEGVLPYPALPDRESLTIDLEGVSGACASVVYDEERVRVYAGARHRLQDVQWEGLRAVPGWTPGEMGEVIRGETGGLNCPSCGAAVELRAPGQSVSAVCAGCGSILDASQRDLKLLRRVAKELVVRPELPLGRRGILFGVSYEVIGFQRVRDAYDTWSEFLLFNPWHGFRWLTTFQGHWNWVERVWGEPVQQLASTPSHEVRWNSRRYRLYAKNEARTVYVLGEFYWKLRLEDAVALNDYVDPPHLLSSEHYPATGEISWSEGTYVDHAMVSEAFAMVPALPEPDGVFLNQPNPHLPKWQTVRWLAPVLLVLLGLVQAYHVMRTAERTEISSSIHFRRDATNSVVLEKRLVIKDHPQAVEVFLASAVDNSWMEADVDFIEESSGREVSVEMGNEYYHGYEDGEYWNEGSKSASRILPSLEPGVYRVMVEATVDERQTEMPYTVTVVRDVVVWSNFFFGLALILAYPLYVLTRYWLFEQSRWGQSDYSPNGGLADSGDDD